MGLDLIDKKILYYLDRNARQSTSTLAKKLKIGRNVALYRINKLKEKEIIKGAFAEINSSAIGFYTFRIFFKLGNTSKDKQDKLFNFLSKEKNITWFSRVIGKWDLDVLFMTKKIFEFENFRKNLFNKFNSIIGDSEISLLTHIYYYPKDYLLNNKRKVLSPTILDMGLENKYVLDKNEEKILHELSKNAFINLADLSHKLKISVNTLKKKIKFLENKKIILGYRLFIDPTRFGYEYYKFHVSLKDYKEEDISKMRNWLASHSFVIYTDHYINGADFEIELMFKKESEYLEFLDKFLNEFGRIIKDHYLIKFYDLRIFKYLP